MRTDCLEIPIPFSLFSDHTKFNYIAGLSYNFPIFALLMPNKIVLTMKITYLFSVFFLIFVCAFNTKAQDFLVTKSLDSLNCKLGQLENDLYPIKYHLNNEKIVSGFIHKDSILFFKRNMFRSIRNNQLLPWYPLKDFGLDAGVAHQFGIFSIAEKLADKSDFAARTGLYANADMAIYVNQTIGFGLKYNFRSLLGGDIQYHYVGPMAALRIWNKNKKDFWFIHASGGFGWMKHKNAPVQIVARKTEIDMTARAFAGDLSAGYNFRLSSKISLRTKLSAIVGYPSFVQIRDIKILLNLDDSPIDIGNYCNNMNSINLSIGITFHNTKPFD